MGRLPNVVNSVEAIFEEARMMTDSEIRTKKLMKKNAGLIDTIKLDSQINTLEYKSSKLIRVDQCLTTFAGIVDDPVYLSQRDLIILGELKSLLNGQFDSISAALTIDDKNHIESKKNNLQRSYLSLFDAINDVKNDKNEVLTIPTIDRVIKDLYQLYDIKMSELNKEKTTVIPNVPSEFELDKEEIEQLYNDICSKHHGYDSICINFSEAYNAMFGKLKCEYMLTLINNLRLSRYFTLTSNELDKLKIQIKAQKRSCEALLRSVGLSELFEPLKKEPEESARVIEEINQITNNPSGFYDGINIEPDDFNIQIRKKK
jgi:hypothetical protein